MEWNQDAKDLLGELVKPIPIFARPMAKKKIEGVILKVVEGDEVTKQDELKDISWLHLVTCKNVQLKC